jgi:hypothetical protein
MITCLEAFLYLISYGLSSIALLITYAFSTDNCHGAGATYPGGCPEFTAATEPRFAFLFVIQIALLIIQLYLFLKFRLKGNLRLK